ncbi:interleukin-1 receptor accessory protein-like 1-B isoform X2 [Hippocampus comes]|uniref:interleukin-1 receptor accessory protein-like 1-B isoform X2 n=1 Tax=Hippocampus comes TaxID=109280 RepID=UPI00094EEC0A|nr:PREDICTED: interleukin-1 receptor accessory protein-like 1-B isoform X2 [Hippocampus comes]
MGLRLCCANALVLFCRSGRLSKEYDRLCFQPAVADDSGCYACLPRDRSAGIETWVRVMVVRRPQVAPGDSKCERPLAVAPGQVVIALQGDQILECPDWREAADMADAAPAVTWYHACSRSDRWTSDREQFGAGLQVHYMVDHYQGLYTCQVHYRRGGRELHFTRGLNVTAVCEDAARAPARHGPIYHAGAKIRQCSALLK